MHRPGKGSQAQRTSKPPTSSPFSRAPPHLLLSTCILLASHALRARQSAMYVAIRPALRSSSRARPARLINGRRYPQTTRVQSFHSTRFLAHTPTPTPTPDNTNVDASNADKKSREKSSVADHVEAPETIEDPEILAQKLQRSRELARRYSSALRRSQRRNRAHGLPPIYIPDWFLEGRVRLREDAHPQRALARRSDCTLELKHKASGEKASLSIPVSTHAAAFKAISQIIKALWRQGLSKEHREMLARDFARRMGREDDEEFVKALERGEEPRVGLWQEAGSAAPEDTSGVRGEGDLAMELKMRTKLLQDGRRISPLLLAEIRATMAASLSTIQPATTHSFPAAKTNLILHSPSNDYETVLHSTVQLLAAEFGADVVTLNAQDLAQLAGDYLGEGPEPSPDSIRSLGYETYKYGPSFADEMDLWPKEETVEEEPEPALGIGPIKFHIVWKEDGKRPSQPLKSRQSASTGLVEDSAASSFQSSRGQSTSEVQLEDLKLSTLLEALVDTNELKRSRGITAPAKLASTTRSRSTVSPESKTTEQPQLFDYSFESGASELDFSTALPADVKDALSLTLNNTPSSRRPAVPKTPKIIYVKDIKELNATQYGSRIMQKLEEIVRKQRNAGESVMLLGTTCSEDLTPEISPSGFHQLQSEGGDGFYRTIVVTPGSVEEDANAELKAVGRAFQLEMSLSTAEKKKFRDINLRHIHDMLRCLDPQATANLADLQRNREGLRRFSSTFPQQYFWSVLSYDSVHRIALTALGLRLLDSNAEQLSWAHVTLAMGLLQASDQVKYNFANFHASDRERQEKEREAQHREHMDRLKAMFEKPAPKNEKAQTKDKSSSTSSSSSPSKPQKKNLAAIEKSLNPYEKRLLSGIVDADNINTTFDKIHVPKDTVDAIRSITSMSLLRPDAFNYGVLATEKISGALLYGPPGTGKTLLAKAVAKESGSTMLEISGSQIMDKYVGEGEKNVAAAFSLARRLSPCVLFLDEADAIFCTRDAGHERGGHRDVLNQFLKEWDGLRDMSVFVMVATNRPFDMDDAVIRRLPRRLLVDLPKQEDRKEILNIHLRGEEVAPEVDLDDLAKRTPLYSGSDLKNVVVFAALAAVREENEIAAVEATKRIAELAREAGEATVEGEGEMAEAAETAESAADSGASPAAPAAAATTSGTESASATSTTSTPTISTTSTASTTSTHPPILTAALASHYTFPPRRILQKRHFDRALQEVSASISENMHSLNAIRKFDETYGDRRGRKKKTMYGFGVHSEDEGGAVEEAARVRR
ncbi:AAA-domain-containing protein [Westerdykella ornata]|uniref:AAA-domain-containing protein n=1 Tax=Westerdykella ornata TaxID=318751 RepID=A0A6A6J9I0_WESOR|nr:AAA-domain-containing protein [Westerdykella ornata]KAF2272833.1 AAA-domain-containing protein [Westerdykella ornata]